MMTELKYNLLRGGFLVGLLLLGGCSSDSKKQSGNQLEDSDTQNSPADSKNAVLSKGGISEPVEKEKVKVAPPAAGQYDALNESIRSQNDEKMYNSATQILIQSPSDGKALNAMAMYNYKKGRFDVSKFLLGKGIAANPRLSALHSNLGLVLLAQKERREAIQSFRRALELDNGDAVAAANLGAIYVEEQDYNKALIVLETAYRKGNRDPRVLNNYGVALTANRKFDRAEEVYKSGLKDQSTNKELLLNYAILLVDNLNKYQEGLEILNKLKFVGVSDGSRNRVAALENKASAGGK